MNIFKKSFHLTTDSISFVMSDLKALAKHLRVIFPLFLIFALMRQYAVAYEWDWAALGMVLFIGYAVSCFFLTWHKVCLIGADQKPQGVFDLRKNHLVFHGMFFAIFLTMAAVNGGLRRLGLQLEDMPVTLTTQIAGFGLVAASILVLAVFLRMMIFLPAQSVGNTLGFRQAWTQSEGMAIPLIMFNLILMVVLILIVAIYMIVLYAISEFAFGNPSVSKDQVAFFGFFITVPVYAVTFVFLAIEVTGLSTLYKDRMDNNA